MLVIDKPKSELKSLFLKYNQSPQGIYIFEGFSANVGVLPYMVNADDGKAYATGIFTSDNELFKPESLESLVGVAVVKEHPPNFTAEINDMGGIVLSAEPYLYFDPNQTHDYDNELWGLRIKVAIWDDTLLEYIANGNTEISAGYTADILESSGSWHGSPYSFIKTNIIYNHLAIVGTGSARNGDKSKLLNDKKEATYLTFNINKEKTQKLIDSITVIDADLQNKNSGDAINADIKNSSDIIDDDHSSSNAMKNYALPNGKVISLSDDIHTDISDAIDNLIREKQTLELNTNNTLKEKEKLASEFEDTKTKTQELTKKIEQSASNFSRSVAIAAKAEKLGVKVDYENFDPLVTMRKALKANHPKVDSLGEETLNYLFDLEALPIAKKEEDLEDGKDTDDEKENNKSKDNVTDSIKRSVKNEKQTKGVTAESLADEIAASRKVRSNK